MKRLFLPFLAALLVMTACFSLCLGQYRLQVTEILQVLGWNIFGSPLLTGTKAELVRSIFFEIRLPRVLAATLIGASLSVSGAAYQAMFINPLVSPDLLGVLAGASFGAALGMVLSKSWVVVQCSTLAFGFAAVGIAVGIANIFRTYSVIILVLGGIISGAFFTSSLSIVKYTADPTNQLPAIIYWLMGSLSAVDGHTILTVSVPILFGIGTIILHSRHMNALSMGDEEAKALGIHVGRVRIIVIFSATLISALTVMVGGIISWIGLLIPHICRMTAGPDNRLLLPASALMGAIYLLVIDNISRLLFSFEIPAGIVTSLIGIPFFILVLKDAQRGWR